MRPLNKTKGCLIANFATVPFIFEISYRGKTLVVWPDKSVFDDEFRTQVATWQEAEEGCTGRADFLLYKEKKVGLIMSLTDEKLLHSTWKA